MCIGYIQQLLDQVRETASEKEKTQHQVHMAQRYFLYSYSFAGVHCCSYWPKSTDTATIEEKLAEVKKCNDEAMQQCQEEHTEQLEMVHAKTV